MSVTVVCLANTFAKQLSLGEETVSSNACNSRPAWIVREVSDTERSRVSLSHGFGSEKVVLERSAHHLDEGQEPLA